MTTTNRDIVKNSSTLIPNAKFVRTVKRENKNNNVRVKL